MSKNTEIEIENVDVKEKKKVNKLTLVIIILSAVIVIAAATLGIVYIVDHVQEKNREKEYTSIVETLMDCYLDQDVIKYENLCYPGDFLQLEADAYYDGSVSDLEDELKSNLKSEYSSIKSYYNSQVEFKVYTQSVAEATSSEISSVQTQMNSWTSILETDDKKIKTAYRIDFNLGVTTTGGSNSVDDCTALIVTTEDNEKILWDWSFNDASWDTYTYYSED